MFVSAINRIWNHIADNRIDCDSYDFARLNIYCDCPMCRCPYQDGRQYSFRYVDEVRKCIYYDVPKAGSSTIRGKLGVGGFPHRTSLTNPLMKYEEYFKFSIVRNPWDRLYSNWRMFTTQPFRIKQLSSMTNSDLSSFSNFVSFAVDNPNHHWQPQSIFVPSNIDYCGRLENMREALLYLSNLLPNFDASDVKINATRKHKDQYEYRQHYTVDTKNIVIRYYHADIERFEYEF